MNQLLTRERIGVAAGFVIEEAKRRQLLVTVVVTDDAGTPLYLVRMTGARPLSVELASGKAVTAARTGRATHEWARMLDEDPSLARAAMASLPDLVLFGGGIPLRTGSAVIGAVGVSGASQADDQLLAELLATELTFTTADQGELDDD